MKTQLQNNKIPLFDLHCDTFLELYKRKSNIQENNLHISLNKAKCFAPYIQIAAIWSEHSLPNELLYERYLNVREYIRGLGINTATKFSDVKQNSFILAIEDARILNGKLSRLCDLYQDGVRFITLNWKDVSIIGGGWNTSYGLTEFGRAVVNKCLDLGITVDISHSSEKTSYEAVEICSAKNTPLIASHSNSYKICSHKRNLSDELFNELIKLHSLVGISLANEHLVCSGFSKISTIVEHIYHFLSLGGENIIALGCDFDGVSSLPTGISNISDLPLLFNEIEKSFGEKIAKKVFFDNAYHFMSKNMS